MVTEAVLITGGKSAEMFHPDRDSPCVLPDLPDMRHSHSQDGSLVCGGDEAERMRDPAGDGIRNQGLGPGD